MNMEREERTMAGNGNDRCGAFAMTMGASEPRHADAAEGARDGAARNEEGTTILLVEDHADTALVMKLLLERKGYHVTTAPSVGAALEVASRENFDLLISDIGLPDGSGIDLIQRLSERRPVKGIALSGFGMEEDVRRSIEAGFAEHLIKPVSYQKLREAIQRILC